MPIYFTTKSGATSPLSRILAAMAAIQTSLTANEPQTTDELAVVTGEVIEIVRVALLVMRERLEVVRELGDQWRRRDPIVAAFDPLGPKEAAILAYIESEQGPTLDELTTALGYNRTVIFLYLRALVEKRRIFMEQDHENGRRMIAVEVADAQYTNAKLQTAYTDLAANEGSTILQAASRLYPSLDLRKAVALTMRAYRCLKFARAIVELM